MRRIVIATIKDWHIQNALALKKQYKNLLLITDPRQLQVSVLNHFNPDVIFFPHWSWMIPAEVYQRFNCIAFHMTDLPFGRGGSPLQNLIVRGINKTKISAIQVVQQLDGGDVYLKNNLSLKGTAQEIFNRASRIIFTEMIPRILKKKIHPKPQQGKVVVFKRRTFKESDLKNLSTLKDVYDYIRMLDCPGYPLAFVETKKLIFKFDSAKLNNKQITAKVTIEVKK